MIGCRRQGCNCTHKRLKARGPSKNNDSTKSFRMNGRCIRQSLYNNHTINKLFGSLIRASSRKGSTCPLSPLRPVPQNESLGPLKDLHELYSRYDTVDPFEIVNLPILIISVTLNGLYVYQSVAQDFSVPGRRQDGPSSVAVYGKMRTQMRMIRSMNTRFSNKLCTLQLIASTSFTKS